MSAEKLTLSRDSEDKFDQDLCLNLWYDIKSSYFDKMNWTLGSVVPLAMFWNLIPMWNTALIQLIGWSMDIERLQNVTSQFWDFCQLLRPSGKSDENLGFGIEELGKLPTEFNWVWIQKFIIFSLMREKKCAEARTNWLRVVAAGSHWEKLIRCWSALTMGDDIRIL